MDDAREIIETLTGDTTAMRELVEHISRDSDLMEILLRGVTDSMRLMRELQDALHRAI